VTLSGSRLVTLAPLDISFVTMSARWFSMASVSGVIPDLDIKFTFAGTVSTFDI
jgi:hypothetical protein